MVIRTDTVVHEIVENPRQVQLHPMRQVATMGQIESQYFVTGLQAGNVNRLIGLRTRMRLNIGEFGAEQLRGAIPRDIFNHVNEFAPSVIASSWISFRVFIGQYAADRFHDGGAGIVFAGDHLQAKMLPARFFLNDGKYFWILGLKNMHDFRLKWVIYVC